MLGSRMRSIVCSLLAALIGLSRLALGIIALFNPDVFELYFFMDALIGGSILGCYGIFGRALFLQEKRNGNSDNHTMQTVFK